jgi:hypothetical protein
MNLDKLVKATYWNPETGSLETMQVTLEYIVTNPIGVRPEDVIVALIEAVREEIGLPPILNGFECDHKGYDA